MININTHLDENTKTTALVSEDSYYYEERGNNNFELENYTLAIIDYTKAIEFDNKNYFGFSNRGLCYLKTDNYELAIYDISKAIELESTNSHDFFNRGDSYFNLNNYLLALNDYIKAIELDPNDIDYYIRRGDCYIELENYQLAIEDFSIAIELNPNDVYNYSRRGICKIELENYQLAIDDFTKAIEIVPTDPSNYSNRGNCYYGIGKLPLAIDDFTKAIELDPNNFWCYRMRAFCNFDLKNYKLAIEDFTKTIELDPTEISIFQYRAYSYENLGNLDKALLDFEQIFLLYLNDEEFYKYIVEINEIKALDIDTQESEPINNFEVTKLPTLLASYGFKLNPHNEIGNDFKNISGVYILEFKTGEFYVGETNEIHKRLKSHFKTHKDILNIFFKPVIQNELSAEETKTIAIFEKKLLRIRNLKQVKFNNLFNLSHQLKWVKDLSYNYLSGNKFDNETVREQFSDRFTKLKSKQYFSKFISMVSLYIQTSIPNYLASEYNYWNITCLPTWLAKSNFVSRININAVPILSVQENADNTLSIMFFVSILPFIEYLKERSQFNNLFNNIPSLTFGVIDSGFENTDKDAIVLNVNDTDFYNAMNNDVILSAIRLFSLRIMNKTGDEKQYTRKRNHCLDLADCIIDNIAKHKK